MNKFRLFGWWLWGWTVLYGQTSRWVDMLSYTHITGISTYENYVFAATENAFFIYDAASGEFEKFSTIRGISASDITAYYYHALTGSHFIAHRNGLIEIIDRQGSVFHEKGLYLSFLPEEQKIIRAIASDGNRLFLGMNFGITEYRIDSRQFGDTYYIGTGGTEVQVNDLAVWDGILYAATTGQGVKYIETSNPFMADPLQWHQIASETWPHLAVFQNKVYGLKWRRIYEITGGRYVPVYTAPDYPIDIAANDNAFFVAYPQKVDRLNALFTVEASYTPIAAYPFEVQCIHAGANALFIGTGKFGVLRAEAPGRYVSIHPSSPTYNRPFATDVYDGYIWVVYGDYSAMFDPYPLDERDVDIYAKGRWHRIPYAAFGARSLTDVKINPADTTQVFVGSYIDGLLEFRHGQLAMRYDGSNAPFPPLNSGSGEEYRISPLEWDEHHNLWMYEALVMEGIHVWMQGQWQSYSFDPITSTPNNEGVAQMSFDADGNLWLATLRWGLVGMNPHTGEMVKLDARNGIPYEIPSYPETKAAAVDKDNILWIGTANGLRILRNPARAFTDPDIQTERIIILLEELEGQDNQGTELLMHTDITEIVVDGANNKWIGTNGAGVFYLSEDGQQTLYHFTADNSPLPGNSILDISVDPVTGLVLFATDRGLAGFKGDASEGRPDLGQAYVYPNPAIHKRHDHVIIRNLMSDISVKITDIEGNLVYETRSKGGSVRWNMRNFAGRPVASGVYLIFLTNEDGSETKVLKLLIIY